jgi:endonuclease III
LTGMKTGETDDAEEVQSVESLLSRLQSYSEELGLDLSRPEDRFRWFLASMLFAKRISSGIAKRTYMMLEEEGLTTPEEVTEAGWDRLVEVLDSGGYVRYDFSTASNLLEAVAKLQAEYGNLENMHDVSEGPRDLEGRLMELKGVGPVCVNIFLRELRGIWEKADPPPSKLAQAAGQRLGLDDVQRHESALVRLNIEYCKRRLCGECPFRDWCSEAVK